MIILSKKWCRNNTLMSFVPQPKICLSPFPVCPAIIPNNFQIESRYFYIWLYYIIAPERTLTPQTVSFQGNFKFGDSAEINYFHASDAKLNHVLPHYIMADNFFRLGRPNSVKKYYRQNISIDNGYICKKQNRFFVCGL